MSELIESINTETGKFKGIFKKERKNGYSECQQEVLELMDKEIEELERMNKRSDDFDSAVLSVVIGYTKMICNKIIDLEYSE